MALSGSKSYTLTIGNGPLAITIGTIHSASGLDASSHAEAPPTLSLSQKTSQGKTASVRPPVSTSSSLAFFSRLLVARLLTTHWLKSITAHHLGSLQLVLTCGLTFICTCRDTGSLQTPDAKLCNRTENFPTVW